MKTQERNKAAAGLFFLALSVIIIFAGCQPAAVDNNNDDDSDTVEMFSVKARMVTNRDYYPAVFDLFSNAEMTMDIIMYDMKYYDYDPETEESKLLGQIVTASLRGVDVRVILEQSDWNSDVNDDNYATGAYLEQYGVDVRYDPMTVTTHCKMMVIDSIKVMVGSTNWTKSAINYNNEANALLEGEEIAASYLDYFNTLWNSSQKR